MRGRPIHALVAETRPGLEGARIAAWELRQGGVPHAIVTDAAAPGCIAAGEVGAVLVTADRVAANGDILATAGSYALALAASAAGVPFVVCVATTAVDLAIRIGDDATIEEGRPTRVLIVNGKRVAPEGTQIRNPIQDLVPAAARHGAGHRGGRAAGPVRAGDRRGRHAIGRAPVRGPRVQGAACPARGRGGGCDVAAAAPGSACAVRWRGTVDATTSRAGADGHRGRAGADTSR